jgi:hypothetical protein
MIPLHHAEHFVFFNNSMIHHQIYNLIIILICKLSPIIIIIIISTMIINFFDSFYKVRLLQLRTIIGSVARLETPITDITSCSSVRTMVWSLILIIIYVSVLTTLSYVILPFIIISLGRLNLFLLLIRNIRICCFSRVIIVIAIF